MENNMNQRPIFNGLLESSVYEGKLVKVTFQPAKQAGWSNSYRLLFLIEGLMINGVEHIYFVNTFINDVYRSGSKTARYLQALGVTDLKGVVTLQELEALKGKKVKMYLEPGKEYFSNKLQRNVQNMEVMSMNAVNRNVTNPVAAPTQKPFIMQQPVTQNNAVLNTAVPAQPVPVPAPVAKPQVTVAPAQVQVPVVQAQPVQQPVQQTVQRPVQNGAWNSNGTPMSVNTAANIVSKPTFIPASQPQNPLGADMDKKPMVQQSYTAAPATQVVEQPLPQGTFVPEELEF